MVREHVPFRRFHRLLAAGADEAAIRGENKRAAAVEHVLPVLVAVGTFDLVGAADADVVGRSDSLAALVEADEEIELPLVLEDRRRFDGAAVAARQSDRR